MTIASDFFSSFFEGLGLQDGSETDKGWNREQKQTRKSQLTFVLLSTCMKQKHEQVEEPKKEEKKVTDASKFIPALYKKK